MNKRIKKKWLKALRSGEYVQGGFQLVETDENGQPEAYCCLGVLSDLYYKEKKRVFPDCDYDQGYPVDEVMEWAGFEVMPFTDYEGTLIGQLARWNDGRDCEAKSFKQIASLLEKRV